MPPSPYRSLLTGVDPISGGLVQNLSRPAQPDRTEFFSGELGSKRLELMREILPAARTFAVLVNPSNPRLNFDTADIRKHADNHGHEVIFLQAGNDADITNRSRSSLNTTCAHCLSLPIRFFTTRIQQFAGLATKYRVPASYAYREFVAAGGLVSYGTDLPDIYRQSALYVGRVLGGALAGELPVQQPRKYPLIVNLKTASSTCLIIPQMVLARADEAIA